MSIQITKLNEVYLRVECDPSVALELSTHFSFRPDGYQFAPKYKARVWDGYIRLFNVRERKLYTGLYNQLVEYLDANGYDYNVKNSTYGSMLDKTDLEFTEFCQYVSSLNLHASGKKIDARDYQLSAAFEAIKQKRLVAVSATSSGKSLIIYIIVRYLIDNDLIDQALLIFPSTGLIQQMYSDFDDYSSHNGFDVSKNVHLIYSGQDKESNKSIHMSTWQSIYKLDQSFYTNYGAMICDEVHNAKSDSFINIFTNCSEVGYRFGFTGTLSEKNKVHKLVVQGLLGPAYQFAKTAELIERNEASDIEINCLMLGYSDETKKANKKFKYAEEFSFICQHEKRNKFIKKLALSLTGNTIILFQHGVQGKALYNLVKDERENVFYIDGKTKPEERERIRQLLDTLQDAIVVASYGTTSTGWSVKNLHNGIFASPYKSETKVLQSVGRGLRMHDSKDIFKLYDIIDDMTWKDRENYVLQHFYERLSYYINDSLTYKIHKINIEK